jgi:hypothetical protein
MEPMLDRSPGRGPGSRWLAVLLVAAALGAPQAAPREAAERHPGQDALDYAFKFASAIETDPKDRSQAQAGVVLDYATIDAMDAAIAGARSIDGFRRGTTLADLAARLARTGHPEEARALVTEAEAVARTIEGWEHVRISAHVAQALAALGEVEGASRLAADLVSRDVQQYAGRAAASEAEARAVRGEFDRALARLEELGPTPDYEAAWWRTIGYLEIAKVGSVSADQRQQALDAARRSAEAIEGWRRIEALVRIADEYRKAAVVAAAREALEAGGTLAQSLPDTMTLKAPLVSSLAEGWAAIGATEQARALLAQAERVAQHVIEIDRPGILAGIAGSYAVVGDAARAARVYDEALHAAGALRNARPRALAVVAIGRSMGRAGFALDDELRARLDGLFAGLGYPW